MNAIFLLLAWCLLFVLAWPVAILALVDQVTAELYPGTPVLPMMTTGATDGIYTTGAGIPTYGIEGMFSDPDLGHIHGLNERIRVSEILGGRRFHYKFVKAYTGS